MGVVERRTYADTRQAGLAYAATGLAFAAGAGTLGRSTTVATWVAAGGRSLHRVALDVATALAADDLDTARDLLPSLVGRDPDALDAAGIARATIESVAENTTDAVVAPAMWAALAGAPGVLAHRAADTMDSMVGYRSERYERFGWAAARLDDALAWGPARLGVALVMLARPRRARAVIRTVRRDAPAHPSPNAGVIEAAFAGALGVRLGGPTTYRGVTEDRPQIGDGRTPDAADIAEAVALSHEITTALVALLVGYGVARLVPRRR
jgi:adenosylcobinamide-phosphate synthase